MLIKPKHRKIEMGKNNGIFLNLNFRDNSKLIPNNIAKNPIKEAKLIGGNNKI